MYRKGSKFLQIKKKKVFFKSIYGVALEMLMHGCSNEDDGITLSSKLERQMGQVCVNG